MNLLSFTEIKKLSLSATIKQIVEGVKTQQRAFVTTAKLMLHLETQLTENETLGAVLKAKGVKKTTVDNARYAMSVWKDLVDPGHITEKVFDTFTFSDCMAIRRVMAISQSKKPLEGEDVAVIIKNSPDWDEELACLTNHGMTLGEKAALDAEKEKPSADAPGETDAPQGTPSAAPTETGTVDAPAGTTPNAGAAAPGSPIVPFTPPAATAADALRLIDTVESMMLELPENDQKTVAMRVLELAETINNYITEKAAAPAPKKTDRKAA